MVIDRVGRSDTETPARLPDEEGVVERDGVRVYWEAYGEEGPTILLLPTWSIIHSRNWKAQIPYLARHFRVITFDGRGNGLSDRPDEPSAYHAREFVADAVAVLDAAQVDSACVAGMSMGGLRALLLAAGHPERVDGVFLIGPTVPLLTPPPPGREGLGFDDERDEYVGWAKYNRNYWLQDYRGFLEFFFSQVFPEPHSTKQIEDCVTWGLDTTPETLILTMVGGDSGLPDVEAVEALCRSIECPTVVVHGTLDAVIPLGRGERVAELTGSDLVRMEGSGHAPHVRDPVKVNVLLRDFAGRVAGMPPRARTWPRSIVREKRALLVSSPIGLGHAWRDVAIADELRRQVPGLEIDWLAQEPVTSVLLARGERIHPSSALLASEAAHIDREAGEHDLHAFQALRRMDEIFCANFMVFDDLVRDEQYDLWVADEGWEIDYFLHENPELKTAPYAWLTDFVGYLPMPSGGDREAALTADYNAEMIEHIDRHPGVRDRAIFVGDPGDVVPASFGSGLPEIRTWTEGHYRFAGYVTGFDPRSIADRDALRAELGYGDEPVCLVAVGGSGVGAPLLRRAIEAIPLLREQVPGLRTIVVAGPRIDPESLPPADGVEVVGYVHELYRHLAACDVAIVQGGLTTTMELVAAQRPFVSIPLASHFEQRFHVRHRLDRYGARNWIDYDDATPESLADVVGRAIGTEPSYRPIAHDGAANAAALIAELL
ncbi:MAG TPA: alpha/beta fold hydrolase [Gaiellaceae bacterium]|nr:alpha/beta fold hydrolase [Gaiellaceae bacterium]